MEGNLLRRIDDLTRMIEEYKKKATDRIIEKRNVLNPITSVKENVQGPIITPQQRPNVHVNPNFKTQNPVILINPKIPLKPLIHVNPRIMKTVMTLDSTQTSTLIQNLKTHVDTLLNGKNISISSERSMSSKNANISNKQNSPQTSIKKSVYVNPKLMKKLSSAAKLSIEKTVHPNTSPTQARLKAPIKNVESLKSALKRSNSNIVMLSKNKLVRIKRGSPGTKKSAILSFQKTRIVSRNSITNVVSPKVSNTGSVRHSKLHVQNIHKINKYSINKLKNSKVKPKKLEVSEKSVKNIDGTELIRIEGIVYKSTRNRLIRRSYPLKKKRLENTNRSDKFLIATNGKKLSRLKISKYNVNATNVTAKMATIGNKNTSKNILRNKVKQKSIQILRNKMRKNNQPCLIFQRFGYCANEKNGTCHKLHDRKQVSVCKK